MSHRYLQWRWEARGCKRSLQWETSRRNLDHPTPCWVRWLWLHIFPSRNPPGSRWSRWRRGRWWWWRWGGRWWAAGYRATSSSRRGSTSRRYVGTCCLLGCRACEVVGRWVKQAGAWVIGFISSVMIFLLNKFRIRTCIKCNKFMAGSLFVSIIVTLCYTR